MRTSARMAGAAVAVATGALLVSGCGSSDGKSGADQGSAAPNPNPKPTVQTSGEEDGTGALPGIWHTKADGKEFVLTIAGDAVTLLRQKSNCTGRVMDAGQQTLVLKCPGGTGEERTNGTVDDVNDETLKVSWNGGATDSYTRIADAPAKLPKNPKDIEKLLPGS